MVSFFRIYAVDITHYYTHSMAFTTRYNHRYALALTLFLLMTAGMVAWQLSGTDWVDDWNYKLMPGSYKEFWEMKGSKIATFDQAIEAVGNHHRLITPRLPNYLQTIANFVPAWIVRTLHGLMLAAAFLTLALSCGGKRVMRSAGFVAVLWLTTWIVLPLSDHMISSDFAFNYLWTSPIIMIFVYLFVSGRWRSGRWSFVPWVVAAVTGMMHEGASLPIAAGCAALIAIDKADRRRRIALLVLMAGVALVFFFNSGMMTRIDQLVISRNNTSLNWRLIRLALECYGLYLAIACMIIIFIKRGRGETMRFAKDNIIWLTATAGATAITLATMTHGRSLWFVDLFGLILFFKALYRYFRWWSAPRYGIATIAGVSLLSSITASAVIQHRLSAESDFIAKRLSSDDSPIVFIDFIAPDRLPWWTFRVPQSITESYSNGALTIYHTDKFPYTLMLPTEFSDKKPEEWPKTAGDTGLSGRFPLLAGRKRLSRPDMLILTFRGNAPFGDRLINEGPVNALMNLARNGGKSHSTAYPVREWAIEYMGDTLWCYTIERLRNLDINVGITRIDTIR